MKTESFTFSAARGFLLLGVALTLVSGCHRGAKRPDAPLSIHLTSDDIPNGTIGKPQSCDGPGASPELSWSAPPAGTQSLALVVTDRDAPFGFNFVHWVVSNIAPDARALPGNLPSTAKLSDGSEQGLNGKSQLGYTPPCPPGKSSHRYDFVLYAIDSRVDLRNASKEQLLRAISGHVLAKGELEGRFGR